MEKYPEKQVSWLVDAPSMAGMVLDIIASETRVCLAMDPRAAELLTWEAWTTWMQVAEAPFAMCVLEPGETTERIINQKTRTLHHLPPGPECDAGTWLTAFFLAVTCRDEKRVASLCQVTPEFLRQASEARGGAYDEYIYPWIAAIQDFILSRPPLGDNLYRAMEMSTPANATISTPENLDKLVFPQVNTFYRLVQQDTEKFDEAVEQGIRLFHDFYTANEERSQNSDGTVPLRLLGLACMAYDLAQVVPGFDPDLDTPYFPKHILERTRHDDFPI
ncbi:immunity 49 family protein [Nocardiopsis sp. CC223A]|uniref:immunity 49 family protein n=1 Tax=Nocardiopsis sp. CC223A TaxID=3044051 RepID=UPI00278C7A6A|nr:immunity 49 family protein [Nocardiopsis sp. CC223A]